MTEFVTDLAKICVIFSNFSQYILGKMLISNKIHIPFVISIILIAVFTISYILLVHAAFSISKKKYNKHKILCSILMIFVLFIFQQILTNILGFCAVLIKYPKLISENYGYYKESYGKMSDLNGYSTYIAVSVIIIHLILTITYIFIARNKSKQNTKLS